MTDSKDTAMDIFGELTVAATSKYSVSLDVQHYLELKGCQIKKIKSFTVEAKDAILRMEAEMKKEEMNRDGAVITECMRRTYWLRRDDIVFHGLSIRNCLEVYPGLKIYDEISREFQRKTLICVDDFERRVNRRFERMSHKQVKHKCKSIYCGLAQSVTSSLDRQRHSQVTLTSAKAFTFSCKQTRTEWWNQCFHITTHPLTPEQARQLVQRFQPTIVVQRSALEPGLCSVYVEKVKVVGNLNFLSAMLACYYLHYIFNLEITRVDSKMFKEFDKIRGKSKSIRR